MIAFLIKEPFAAVSIVLAIIIISMFFVIKAKNVQVGLLKNELREAALKLSEIKTQGEVRQNYIDAAYREIRRLNGEHKKKDKKLQDLLNNFPKTCEEAAQAAAKNIQENWGEE